MLKRLGLGLLKGLVIGVGIGAAFHFGLKWMVAGGLLGYLIAMGTGATAGILAGKPPWRHEAALESVLKAIVGVAVGAGCYYLVAEFAAFGVPFELAGAPESTPWTSMPLLYAPPIAAVFGLLIELDNTPEDPAKASPKPKANKAEAIDVA